MFAGVISLAEALEDSPASGVRECREGPVDL